MRKHLPCNIFRTGFSAGLLAVLLTFALPASAMPDEGGFGTAAEQQTENITVTGVVKDSQGNTLSGVTVTVPGTTFGTITNAQGVFNLHVARAKGASVALRFSFVGMAAQTVVLMENKPLSVVMTDDSVNVDAVVVSTGLINKPRESFVGSARTITKNEINTNYSRNVLQTISMMEPSLLMVENNLMGSNPNGMPEIQLRGASTFRDINDLKTEGGQHVNTPLFIYDGFEISLERFKDLNEDDIASITILKDASATAMYGSRGANGVIVITAPRVAPGEVRVTYRGELKLEIPNLKSYNLLDAKQKLEVEAAAGIWDNNLRQYESMIDRVYNQGLDTDWLDIPTRVGVGHEHRVTVMGGKEKFQYMANASYRDAQGAMKGSYRDNFNGTLYLNYTNNKLDISNRFNYNYVNAKGSEYGSFRNFALMNPYWAPEDENGNEVQDFYHVLTGLDEGSTTYRNPIYYSRYGSFEKSKKQGFLNNLKAAYQITPDLRAEGRLSVLYSKDKFTTMEDNKEYLPAWIKRGDFDWLQVQANEEDRFVQGDRKDTNIEGALTLLYNKVFDKHNLNVGFNTRIASEDSEYDLITALGYEQGYHLPHIGRYDMPYYETKRRSVEFIGTVNYSFDMRYFVDVTYRVDGGSSYGKNSRWENFYSAGAGWNINRESFMKNASFIDLLRVKYNYGVSGGINFTRGQGNFLYGHYYDNPYNGNWIGAGMQQYGNEDLSWQKTYTHNVGLDFDLFNRKVEGEFAYYNSLTKNAIMLIGMTPSHGYPNYHGNIGKVRNEGYELKLTVTPVRNQDWLVKVTGLFAHNYNTVVQLSQEMKDAIALEEIENPIDKHNRYTYREGESMDAIYVLRSIGIDPATGQRIYMNADGNPQFGTQGLGDAMVYAGNSLPKMNGIVNTIVGYKGWMLAVGVQFQWGGKTLNQTLMDKVENVDWQYNVDRRVYSDRWRKPGDRSIYKDIGAGIGMTPEEAAKYVTHANTEFVQKNDNFAVAFVNLMYNTPTEWLQRHMPVVKKLTLSLNLSDVAYSATIRRERGVEYPYTVNPNFNISVTF